MKRLFSLEQYLLIGAIIILLLAILFPFFQALLLGLFLALLMYVPYVGFKKFTRLPSSLAAFLFTLGFSIIVVLPLLLLSFSLVSDATQLFTRVRNDSPMWVDNFLKLPWVEELRTLSDTLLGQESHLNLNEKALQILTLIGGGALDFVTRLIAKLPGFLLDVGIFLLTFFFGLMDGPKLAAFFRDVLPFDASTTKQLYDTSENICKGVMIGTLAVSVTQAILIGLGYWITGLSNPLFFAAMTAILSVVPVLGAAPIAFGAVIYLAITGSWGLAFVMLAFAVTSSLSDNILKPLVLRGYSSIHPLLGMLSVLGGLGLFGFLGIFLGPLIAALVLVVLKVMSQAPKGPALEPMLNKLE